LEASHEIVKLCPVPIVILTAYKSADLVEQASKAGVGAFLNKPPEFAEIDHAITIARARHNDLMELRSLNKELEQALKEIKTLTGILPLCANCKKIRGDKGNWERLEVYIEMYSEAVCSHGICPQCSDELYGNEDWYIEMKKEEE